MNPVIRLFRSFTKGLDKVVDKAFNSLNQYNFVLSFCLGATTAFFLRDELNFPTYLRIKESYLTAHARQMREPDVRILRVIDPLTFVEARAKKEKELVGERKTYDDVIREEYLSNKQKANTDEEASIDEQKSDPLVTGLNLGAFDNREPSVDQKQPKFVTERSKMEYEQLMM